MIIVIIAGRLDRLLQKEPVLLMSFFHAVIALAMMFGASVTGPQAEQILMVCQIGLSLYARSQVTPNVKLSASESPDFPSILTGIETLSNDELASLAKTLARKIGEKAP